MAIFAAHDGRRRQVVRMGHPVLRQRAEEVPASRFGTRALRDLGRDLVRTMFDENGAGLAAPQVAAPWRVFAYQVPAEKNQPPVPPTVLVNPVLTVEGEASELGWEGCLSIPGLRGLVPRYARVQVAAFDVEGAPLKFIAEGFHARVIQHEYDHLEGVLFLDRMRDLRALYYEEEWEEYALDKNLPVEA